MARKARRITVKIRLGNQAMTDAYDVGTALLTIGHRLRDEGRGGKSFLTVDDRGTIMDEYGNHVGDWKATA